jgi:glutathione S-transferase
MPTSTLCGTSSPNNDKIGGIPTIHYLDFKSRGRGQVVRLLFEVCYLPPPFVHLPYSHTRTQDAGIAYTDIRYNSDEYPHYKQTKIAELNPAATIPVIELNGRILTQSYAILRHMSRLLGGVYDGETEEEVYFTDLICDMIVDWRTL